MMEYEDVLNHICHFGPYQKRIMVIILVPVVYISFSTPISNCSVGDQKHRCKIPDLPHDTYAIQDINHSVLINTTIPLLDDGSYDQCHVIVNGSKTACDNWVFDYSVFTNTINSQFNLVCDRKLSNAHAIATYFIGLMTSPLLFNPLGDIFGRRLLACVSLTFVAIVRVTLPFSSSLVQFAALRFFDGFFIGALFTSTFVIGLELLDASRRMYTCTAVMLIYCVGEFILVFLAYFIRDWRWLQLAVSIPSVFALTFWWPKVLPESVRWLMSRGRMDEALVILSYAAKTNKRSLPENVQLKYEEEKLSNIQIMKQLFSSRKLLLYWGIAAANWFATSFIFYGIKLNIGELGGNVYLSFALFVLAETIGYSLMFTMDIFGHKRLHIAVMSSTCVACVASIFPILLLDESYKWMVTLFALLGKVSVSAAFGMIYVYTGEIFPTVVRQFTIGTCSFFARTGSLCSPYLYHLADGQMQKALPMILFSVTIAIVTLLTILLPETKRIKLPDQVKDSEENFSKGK